MKLMDFGLAHTTGASRPTQEGMVVGTISYIAPELIQGLPAAPQSDLYELGVMWYELIAGRLPFEGDSVMSVLLKHLYEPPLPPSNYNPAITPALDLLLLKLLSKSPSDRSASAQEIIQQLDQLDRPTASGSLPVVEVSPLDRLARGRLVGRERELEEALGLWQQAKSGEGQVLLLSGEPGIGKTRLLRELAARVALSGGQVLYPLYVAFDKLPDGLAADMSVVAIARAPTRSRRRRSHPRRADARAGTPAAQRRSCQERRRPLRSARCRSRGREGAFGCLRLRGPDCRAARIS